MWRWTLGCVHDWKKQGAARGLGMLTPGTNGTGLEKQAGEDGN